MHVVYWWNWRTYEHYCVKLPYHQTWGCNESVWIVPGTITE